MRKIWLTMILAVGVVLALCQPASAAYPGGNGEILFVRANQIYTISSSGGTATKLTSSGKNYWAKWSPDGKRIAYVNETSAGWRDVWVMNANGSNKQRVAMVGRDSVDSPVDYWVLTGPPTWEPNGKRLAYVAGDGRYSGVYLVKSTAPFGAPVQLQETYTYEGNTYIASLSARSAVWDPDGQHIMTFKDHSSYDLACEPSQSACAFEYNLSTGVATYYRGSGSTDADGWDDIFYGPGGTFGYTVVSHNAAWEISNLRIAYPGFGSRNWDEDGAPSPNGRYMAFTNAASGKAQVYVSSITGSNRRLLTQGYSPDWQPLP
jgi:Tol biopolymer transport system component